MMSEQNFSLYIPSKTLVSPITERGIPSAIAREAARQVVERIKSLPSLSLPT
jgi:hypothetical protein